MVAIQKQNFKSYRKFNYKNQYNSQLFGLNTSVCSGDYEDERIAIL